MEVRVYRHILNIGRGKYIRNLKIVTTSPEKELPVKISKEAAL